VMCKGLSGQFIRFRQNQSSALILLAFRFFDA
jgi:hypothetical protein